jgi:hypothetical protein
MPIVDYKQKYLELKNRFMSSVDESWNDGYRHGMVDAQTEQAQQQSQQSDAMAQQAAGAQPGQPGEGEEGAAPEAEGQPGAEQAPPTSQNPNGDDELGKHIEQLETMLGKSEISPLDLQSLTKTLNDIRSLQVSINLTKSMEAIRGSKLAKSQKPISFSAKTKANLPEAGKKALSLQEQIVGDIFKKWEKDSDQIVSGIGSILNVEGITKK